MSLRTGEPRLPARVTTGMRIPTLSLRAAPVAALVLLGGCIRRPPALAPLPTPPVATPSAVLPATTVPAGHHRLVFKWELDDAELSARGEGVARIASPDSARLDLFLAGGFGGGAAVLIDSTLEFPGPDMLRKVIPQAPLLWATLGRLAIPAVRDTAVSTSGDTIRADFGSPVAWRAVFAHDSLVRLQRVSGDRILEWVERSSTRVHYRNETTRRSLDLTITSNEPVGVFDDQIWSVGR